MLLVIKKGKPYSNFQIRRYFILNYVEKLFGWTHVVVKVNFRHNVQPYIEQHTLTNVNVKYSYHLIILFTPLNSNGFSQINKIRMRLSTMVKISK